MLHRAREGGSSGSSVKCLACGIRKRKCESSFAQIGGCKAGEDGVPIAK